MEIKNLKLTTQPYVESIQNPCKLHPADSMSQEEQELLRDLLRRMSVPDKFAQVDASILHTALLLVSCGALNISYVPDFISKTCYFLGHDIDGEDRKDLALRIFNLVASP